jgi:phosphatidylserine/phosphatidylglycerophosphate/cardiolipin synthase-like enzyme
LNLLSPEIFRENKDYLRYVFLERWGVNEKTAADTEKALSDDRDIQVAIGATLPGDAISHWLAEQPNTLNRNVRFTHTTFMLVDPLGEDPIVITGSANFSDASTTENDKNMLTIRGDKRVADVYPGEFMRLWRHHNFRYMVTAVSNETGEAAHNYLKPDDSWIAGFFTAGRIKQKRRATLA